jgi:hypothetical protein
VELFVIIWIFCGIGSAFVASSRGGNGCLWFGLGFILGPFGLAFSFLSGSDSQCPFCRKRIHPQATKCPYCQSALTAPTVAISPAPPPPLTSAPEQAPASPESGGPHGAILLAGLATLVCLIILLAVAFDQRKTTTKTATKAAGTNYPPGYSITFSGRVTERWPKTKTEQAYAEVFSDGITVRCITAQQVDLLTTVSATGTVTKWTAGSGGELSPCTLRVTPEPPATTTH